LESPQNFIEAGAGGLSHGFEKFAFAEEAVPTEFI
jgi:hypothetical protein